MQSAPEYATWQFYDWEKLGRGRLIYDAPLQIEPPFHPFFGHTLPVSTATRDDGRGHLFSRLFGVFKKKQARTIAELEGTEYLPYLLTKDEPLVIYGISVPKGAKIEVQETLELLLMLSYTTYPVSFEIIAVHGRITMQIVCRESDAAIVSSQVRAYFPDCTVQKREDKMPDVINIQSDAVATEFMLTDEFMCPLAMENSFKYDPYIGLFAALETLEHGESVIIQVMFQGAANPWAESIIRAVTDSEGGSFFADAPEMVKLAQEKVSEPLFAVVVRGITFSTTGRGSLSAEGRISKAVSTMCASPSNGLISVGIDLTLTEFRQDMLDRRSHRLGMLWNARELATIVHLPNASVTSQSIERDTRKTKVSPSIADGHKLVLGTNEHLGKVKTVGVSTAQRFKHMHIIGATGTGKSTLLLSLITQDIRHGNGLCVLDPHGDLIETILKYIPEERSKDVVLIDPADAEFPIGFNILSAHSELEKELLSSDLVAGFKRLSTSWGDQMNSVFSNAILAFLESTKGGTLADLRRFLVEKTYRDTFLKTVSDPNVVYYWQKEYPLLKSNSIGSILTRLDAFLRPKLIRYMVAQKKGLDFEQLMDTKKIILVKLAQGLIGTENSYLLGTMIVSKIQQAAMARQSKAKEDRSDYFLYCDEFQNFITPSMSSILSGARKYNLGLILAHQDMAQLYKYDTELASSVVSNAGTRICFRVGDTDAKRFSDGFSFFEASDLQNLNTGEAIARIDRPEYDFSLNTVPLIRPATTDEVQEAILVHSRLTYGTPKAEVEALLHESMQDMQKEAEEKPVPKPKEEKKPMPVQPVEEQPPVQTVGLTSKDAPLRKNKPETQHRYLQNLIKRMAESRGYKAMIEAPTPDGKGRVDVSLERNGKRIACEISSTTTDVWEIHNVEKCLAADYTEVIVCSSDLKNLERIKKQIENKLTKEQQAKVYAFEPQEIFIHLDALAAKEATVEKVVKGYRVKVEYNNLKKS